MTDSNDERTSAEKAQAEVLDTSGPSWDPQTYLVRYPDGTVQYEPATARNQALFEDDLYDEIDGTSEFDVPTHPDTITLQADVQDGSYVLQFGEHGVDVSDDSEAVINAFRGTGNTGRKLYEVWEGQTDGHVRRGVVELFLEQFPEDRIGVGSNGWVIDDTFLVDYSAENRLVDATVHTVQGDEMVPIEEDKPAVDLSFDVNGDRKMQIPGGSSVTLTEDEQVFLATVETLLYPNDYLDADLVDEIEQAKAESTMDPISEIASSASESGFTSTNAHEWHGHSISKHYASDAFSLTDRAVDEMVSQEYEHIAVTELCVREDEFRSAPFDVFTDVPNNHDRRWQEIKSTRDSAPISAASLRDLKDRLEGKGYDIEVTV